MHRSRGQDAHVGLPPAHRSGCNRALAVAARPVGAVMIRPLRRAHALIWLALAVLLPALFAAAMLSRRGAIPRNPQLQWEQYR